MTAPDFQKEPWTHPAVAGKHVVSMTREYPAEGPSNVATCPCGWTHREPIGETSARWKRAKQDGSDPRDDAVYAHWRDVIAQAGRVPA